MSAQAVILGVGLGAKVIGTRAAIKAEQARSKAQIQQYERDKQMAELQAKQQIVERKKQAEKDKADNLALFAATGFDPSSRSFLTFQDEVDVIAGRDIANIKLNKAYEISSLNNSIYIDAAQSKSKVMGGYASIVGDVADAYGKYSIYKKPTKGKSTT